MRDLRLLMLCAAAAATLAGVGPAQAAAPAQTGLTGIWLLDQDVYDQGAYDPTVKREPRRAPMRPEIKAMADAQETERIEKGQVLANPGRCGIGGMPGMVTNEFATEFLETPGKV